MCNEQERLIFGQINWYSCSNEELEIARTKVNTLLRLADTITAELNINHTQSKKSHTCK